MSRHEDGMVDALIFPRIGESGKVEIVAIFDDAEKPIVRKLTHRQALNFVVKMMQCISESKFP